jgi:hypothetical protein
MFFHLNGAGVERTRLLPKHLARFAVPVTPNEKHPRPLFEALIEASFPVSDLITKSNARPSTTLRSVHHRHRGADAEGGALARRRALR